VKTNPILMAALEKNCFEHISLMAQEQIEIEFAQEINQMGALMQNPQASQNPQMQKQMQNFQIQVESRKAKLISDMMEEFLKEEQQISSQFDTDPIAALRARELAITAENNARKSEYDKERLNIDRMKAMMNQVTQDQKLQQNEDLAKMRADTSIQKTILSSQLKKDSAK
jgi:hypothetical protein